MQNYQPKLIKSARLWLIPIISLLLVSNLSGCAFWRDPVKPVEVIAKPAEKTALAIPNPDPLTIKPIKWVVITPDNAAQVFKQLESKKKDLVLFGLSDDDYQQLSLTMSDLRNFIATQRTIIIKYKDYYEAPKPTK
jgi:hypothetical protein|tara:strand:- start:817 stop:1224 length:408 start_codon:yes stop_codon:yes gene_type:complete